MLNYVSFCPESPRQMVVFLHGYGADAADLASLFPFFKDKIPDSVLVSIEAPFECDSFAVGRQWYPLNDTMRLAVQSQNQALLQQALDETREVREAVANQLKETIESLATIYQIESKNIISTGFSQGAGMALAVSQAMRVGGVISFSGLLLPPFEGGVPFLMTHGKVDSVLPFSSAEKTVEAIQRVRPVRFVSFPYLDHGFSEDVLNCAVEFTLNL